MSNTAVLALHYQNEVLHPKGLIRVGVSEKDPRRQSVIDAAGRMLADARERGWPIMHVRIAYRADYSDCPKNTPIALRTAELGAVIDGKWGSEFLSELAPQDNSREFVFTHKRISGFAGTGLDEILRLLQVEHLLVGGVATHSVVEGTVRDAADRGFHVTVVEDACSAGTPAIHEASLQSMALIAQISNVAAVFEDQRTRL